MSKDWYSGHRLMDPSTMESWFSNEDGMAYLDGGSEEISETSLGDLEKVRTIMDMIPSREADFIDLYFFKRLKQTTIAEIFNVSQPTVCYRLLRATERIKFLLAIPDMNCESIRAKVSEVIKDPVDVEIMVLMQKTTCQSEVAKMIGRSQGYVRHRFIRSIKKIKEKPEGMDDIIKLFDLVASNLNIRREVQRPQWDDQHMKVII